MKLERQATLVHGLYGIRWDIMPVGGAEVGTNIPFPMWNKILNRALLPRYLSVVNEKE